MLGVEAGVVPDAEGAPVPEAVALAAQVTFDGTVKPLMRVTSAHW